MLAGETPVLVHNCGDNAYDWEPFRPGVDDERQGPVPLGALIAPGQVLRKGSYHYVVMTDGSLRAMHDGDLWSVDASAGHTSLAEEQVVHMAGRFEVDEAGRISEFDNWSGHYQPQNMEDFAPLEDIVRASFRGHGLPTPAAYAWVYHDFS